MVQQAIPAAVHDGNRFTEEETKHHDAIVVVVQDVPATGADAAEEEAPRAEQSLDSNNGGVDSASEEGEATAGDGSQLMIQDVAQEVEAKLGVHDVADVADDAAAEAKKPPPKEEERRGREVARKAAKAVVVPVDGGARRGGRVR
ncbi:hypothetical protein ACP4OV_014251 [Aristida adscensionis]